MSDSHQGASDWQRLDARMLLVHPIREVVKFLPVLFLLLVAGTASGGPPWQALGVVVPVALGILRYLTTRYRIAGGRVELSRGLVSRRVTSTPLDRVRTVDLTSSLVQRALGLTTLRIGTGVAVSDGDDQLDLDGLPVERARALRADLLHAVPEEAPDAEPRDAGPLVAFDPRWLRFAPFTGTGLIVVAAALGAGSQVLESFDLRDRVEEGLPAATVAGVAAVVVAVLVLLLVVSVLGYLVTNGGFLLTRAAGAWHVRRGLLTTRETSLDEDRLAGVAIGEPLALRVARGRHLQAIVTGVNRAERGSATLVPPADADVAPRAARAILGAAGPVDGELLPHGPAAARRRWTRATLPPGLVLLAAVVAALAGQSWWWPVGGLVLVAGGAFLAHDRVAGLGHALIEGHVVARSGSLTRKREMLAVEHVIGWNLRATWFQRRQGLTTLSATTAGGSGRVTVLDVPEADGVRLADSAIPDLVSQFTT